MRRKAIPLILAYSLAILAVLAESSVDEARVQVVVVDGGLVRIDIELAVDSNLSLTLPLIGEPDPYYVIVVRDEEGDLLAYEVDEDAGVIEIACVNASRVRVSYYTQSLTSKKGRVWTLNLTSPYPAKVILPANSTVTHLNRMPEMFDAEGDKPVLEFSPGHILVKYIVIYTPPPLTDGGVGEESESQAEERAPQRAGEEGGKGIHAENSQLGFLPLLLLLTSLILATLGAVVVLRSRRRKMELLSDEERAIMEVLRRMGGGAFQSELQRELEMPTTSLWRRVRRLEEKGLVIVEKRGGRNYVKLV